MTRNVAHHRKHSPEKEIRNPKKRTFSRACHVKERVGHHVRRKPFRALQQVLGVCSLAFHSKQEPYCAIVRVHESGRQRLAICIEGSVLVFTAVLRNQDAVEVRLFHGRVILRKWRAAIAARPSHILAVVAEQAHCAQTPWLASSAPATVLATKPRRTRRATLALRPF